MYYIIHIHICTNMYNTVCIYNICVHITVCVCRYATKFRCEHRNPERQTCQELPAAESEGCPVEI